MTLRPLSPPDETYYNEHYFCDYIELLALVNNSSPISKNDVYQRFYENNRIPNIEIDNNSIDEFYDNEIDVNESVTGTNNSFQIEEAWDTRISSWYSLLEKRKIIFNEFYPFDLINNATTVSIKLLTNITDKMKIYIFLLLNSLQKYIDRSSCFTLTSDFEEFSLKAFKKYIPEYGEVHRFGKSGQNYNRYTGHITTKIDDFARDIKCKTVYDSDSFAVTNNGDGGLDIVSWIPFENDDNFRNIHVYLAQCATGKDWIRKQDDVDKFVNDYIHFKCAVQKVMFIPYDSRNLDNTFNERAQMNKDLYMDRQRLLYLTKDNVDDIITLSSFTFVTDIINFEEDIV